MTTFSEKDRNATDTELLAVMQRFHKDFKDKSDRDHKIAKKSDLRDSDRRKRETLGSTANKSVASKISASVNARETAKAYKSVVIPSTKQSTRELGKDLKSIDKTIRKTAKEDRKKNKSIFKSALLQAKIIEGVFNLGKKIIFGGASDTDKVINAINNVERAIRKQKSVELDTRKNYERAMGGESISSIFSGAGAAKGKAKEVGEGIVGIISSIFSDMGSGGTSASTSGAKEGIDNIIEMFTGMFADSTKNAKKSKNAKKTEGNIKGALDGVFDFIGDMFGKGTDKLVNSKFAKNKVAFLGAMTLFADGADTAASAAILHPWKSFKLAMKTFKGSLAVLANRPLLQGVAMMTTAFGGLGGVLSLVLIPAIKLLRPLTKDIKISSFGIGDGLSRISEGLSGVKDSIVGYASDLKKRAGKQIQKTLRKMVSSVVSSFLSMYISSEKFRNFTNLATYHTLRTIAYAKAYMMIAQDKFKKGIDKMKEKTGSMFIKIGAWLGVKATLMMTVMGSVWAVAMAALPFLLVPAIVVGLGMIGKWVYDNWVTIADKWNEWIVTPVVSWFVGMGTTIAEKISEVKTLIGETIAGMFTWIKDKARSASEFVIGKTLTNQIFGGKDTTQNALVGSEITKPIADRIDINKGNALESKKTNDLLSRIADLLENQTIPTIPPSSSIDDAATIIATQ